MTRLLAVVGCALLGLPVGGFVVIPVLGAQTRRQGAPVHPEWNRAAVVAPTVVVFAAMGARFGWSWDLPAFLVFAGVTSVGPRSERCWLLVSSLP